MALLFKLHHSDAPFSKKHIGPIQLEQFEVSVGFGLDRSFYELLNNSFKSGAIRFDGLLASLELNFELKYEREFKSALLPGFVTAEVYCEQMIFDLAK